MNAVLPRDDTVRPPLLIVPGKGNSEPEHWQSLLENNLPDTLRVEQEDWDAPALDHWSRNIDRSARLLDDPPLLVAHSFGCLAAAHARIALGTPMAGVLFVAPANAARFGLPPYLSAERLGVPGMLVASDTDPWLSLEKAIMLAFLWGLECVNLGDAGHINVASGHGRWLLGESIVESMRNELRPNTQAVQTRQSVTINRPCPIRHSLALHPHEQDRRPLTC